MENEIKPYVFRTKRDKDLYYILISIFLFLGFLFSLGLVLYNNPVEITNPSFIPIIKRRLVSVIAMAIATVCQAIGTVSFQAITRNKIITPSLLGYEALYSTIQTTTIFLFGASTMFAMNNMTSFLLQVIVMVALSLLLYGWLLTGKKGDLQLMLLVGMMIGTGLRSLSGFMNRILSPSEFDILQAKLLGSVNNADPSYFSFVIPIILVCGFLVFYHSRKLNVMALGKDISVNLGIDHQRNVIFFLIIVAILMSVSTALLGSLTFFGFLSAALAYQVTKTYDYKYILAMSLAIGFLILTSAYFFMYHIFNAQGVVSIIIELIGGIVFLTLLFRKEKV